VSPDLDPFDWFLDELEEVRTQRFHVVERRPTRSELHATEGESFARCRRLFGTCRLYSHRPGAYLFSAHEPRRTKLCEMIDPAGELLEVATSTGGRLFLTRSAAEGTEPERLYFHRCFARRARHQDESFAEWFKTACARARRQFTKREWFARALDTTPFTIEEQEIVEARRLFEWRAEETPELTRSRKVRFVVTNRSSIRLPFLSIDVRGIDNGMGGRHFLSVDKIGPGETGIVEVNTYDQGLYPFEPEKIHRYEYRSTLEPLPEDKDGYWEFRGLD
jgi:hypothetical protein